ncbi:MAG: hypothetical protein ACOC7R_04430 [Planctomycetota bacterium]
MRALILTCVVALAASAAPAQMLADFEDDVNPFSAGVIVEDPEDPTNHVLFVDTGATAVMTLAEPVLAGNAVSMKVYDQALSAMDDPDNPGVPAEHSGPAGTQYGWNLGVSGTWNWGAFLTNRDSWMNANGGYAWTGNFYASWPQSLGGLYSMYSFGGPRQVGEGGLSIIGTGTIDAPETPGDGAWSTWTFSLLEGGNVMLSNSGIAFQDSHIAAGTDDLPGGGGPADPPNETGFTEVYVCGGRSHATVGLLGDVWIDDVQIVAGQTPPPTLQADFDGDGDVDLDDFVILKTNFGLVDPANGDADGDGDVDLDDFVILKNEFGSTA